MTLMDAAVIGPPDEPSTAPPGSPARSKPAACAAFSESASPFAIPSSWAVARDDRVQCAQLATRRPAGRDGVAAGGGDDPRLVRRGDQVRVDRPVDGQP